MARKLVLLGAAGVAALGIAACGTPTAGAPLTGRTVTPASTAEPAPQPTARPATEPTPAPTPRPAAATAHAAPTPTPVPTPTSVPTPASAVTSSCYRRFTVSLGSGKSAGFEMRASGSQAAIACSSADLLNGTSYSTGTLSVVTVDHLAPGDHLYCSTRAGGIPVEAYDDGSDFSRTVVAGFCRS